MYLDLRISVPILHYLTFFSAHSTILKQIFQIWRHRNVRFNGQKILHYHHDNVCQVNHGFADVFICIFIESAYSDVSILKGCSHFTHVEGLMAGKETALLTTTGSGSWCWWESVAPTSSVPVTNIVTEVVGDTMPTI